MSEKTPVNSKRIILLRSFFIPVFPFRRLMIFMVDFVVRYFKPDGSFRDLPVGLHNLGLPRKYGFFTTLLSIANYHGLVDFDLSTFASNLYNWPRCEVFLRVDSNMYKLFSGDACFGHHGEPEGYRFK